MLSSGHPHRPGRLYAPRSAGYSGGRIVGEPAPIGSNRYRV